MQESVNLTFLFTDIEGSTSKWEEHPEQMAQAVGRHDALLRNAVHQHGGRVVKTTGDGIYAAFDAPADGLGAVIEIQTALLDPATTAGLGLLVRCGLHTGPVQSRDNDYFGSTINRTARIMNAAHGGQILISQALADALCDALPTGVALKGLGSVRLKGLTTSEVVYQVVHPKLYQNFPALRELEATPNNLPQQLTSFIGREREREEIEDMLGGSRLLTLLGMGGLGKTRLSLQIGTSVMEQYPDGVWFIDLQTIRDDSLVASETARVLGVREEPGTAARADADRAPEDTQAGADPRQLRAGDRHVRESRQCAVARCAGGAGAGHEPHRAAGAGRANLCRAAAAGADAEQRTRRAGEIAGRAAVRRAGETAQAEFRAERAGSAGGGRARVSTGRHTAGARAGGRASSIAYRWPTSTSG